MPDFDDEPAPFREPVRRPPPRRGPRSHRRGGAPRPRKRPWLVRLGLAAGLLGLGAAAFGVVTQLLPRSFSSAQQRQISAWEISARWRAWPASRIFPAKVGYVLPASALAGPLPLELIATRAGIARQARCGAATDPALAKVLTARHCLAVLRATYEDATRTMAVTIGVAVFGDGAATRAAGNALPHGQMPPAVRAVPFPRTPTARFGNAQRQLAWSAGKGPYLVLAAVGYADGRPRVSEAADAYATAEMLALARGVARSIVTGLGSPPPPPRCPGVPGC